jgi:pilus assembly protein CpaB
VRGTLRELQRAAARHRALLSAGLAAGAVASGLSVVAPTGEPTMPVVVVTRDVTAGALLAPEDVAVATVPSRLVPAGALTEPAAVTGRVVAGPVRRGEPLTDVRLLGAGLLARTGEVAVPVRVAEPATGALVRAGDRVDVLAASPDGGTSAHLVARDLAVLSVPDLDDVVAEGALVVVAASRSTAARLAAAAVIGRLSVAVHAR